LSVALDQLDADSAARILRLLARVGPLPGLPRLPAASLLQVMRADKKSRGGRLRFVLLRRIGRAEVASDVPEILVTKTVALLPELVRKSR